MAGRVIADTGIPDLAGLAIGGGLKRDIAQAVAHDRGGGLGCQIGTMA